jgi:hypothetical protein
MNDSPINRVLDALRKRDCNPKAKGPGKWEACCPAHEDRKPSLGVKEGNDGTALLKCHAGCNTDEVLKNLGLEMKDLFPPRNDPSPSRKKPAASSKEGNGRAYRTPELALAWHIKQEGGKLSEQGPWFYNDATGSEFMRKYRIDKPDGSKAFRPVYRDITGGWHAGDPCSSGLPLYHLDELAAADIVYLCEGEKCADLARGIGVIATTSSHGADSAKKTDWAPLASKTVVLIPDHDKPGEKYLNAVGSILAALDAPPAVKVLRLPLENKGDDIEQWLDSLPDTWEQERVVQELERLAAAAPEWSAFEIDDGNNDDDVADPIGQVDPIAFHGPLGKLALATQPETEANPLFVLMHMLVFAGVNVGRGPHFIMSGDRHRMVLDVAIVGPSGVGRKGTAATVAKQTWLKIDPLFSKENITDGLNSGKGLLLAVRDGSTPKKSNEIEDPGIGDKRRVFLESEFSAVFKQGHRDSDPLLEYLRKFWDGEEQINSMTKEPLRVTGGHIGAIFHSTPADIEIHLTSHDKRNGTANRVIYIFGVRSKRIKSGGNIFPLLDVLGDLLGQVARAIELAKGVECMRRTARAEKLWEDEVYDRLDEVPSGELGAFFVRASPIVMRIASIFALMDLESERDVRRIAVDVPHIKAALAIWDHAVRSLRHIFHADADPAADKLVAALKDAPDGLNRRQIIDEVFKKNKSAESVTELLGKLLAYRTIVSLKPESKGRGRPATRYRINDWS